MSVSSTSSYQLRESTHAKSTESKTLSPSHGRKILDTTTTASLIRSTGHNCGELDLENTQTKVLQRVWNTFFRMEMAFIFKCKTWQGTTRLTGSSAHCQCEAAHAALCPTLYDDKLTQVTALIQQKGFSHLSPISQKYTTHRFHLNSPIKERLNDLKTAEKCLEELTQQLTSQETKGSYVNTKMEEARNVTFENPRGSNRLDSHLEHTLRPLETELANNCSKGEKKPEEATQELLLKYITLLKESIQNLQSRSSELTQLLKTLNELREDKEALDALDPSTTPPQLYKKFLSKIEQFLNLKTQILKHLSGAPSLNDFMRYDLFKQTPYFQLKTVIKDSKKPIKDQITLYHNKKSQIQLLTHDETVKKQKNDLLIRDQEAKVQLHQVEKLAKDVGLFSKIFFGIIDNSGKRKTPTKSQVADQLITSSHSIEPSSKKARNDYTPRTLNFD